MDLSQAEIIQILRKRSGMNQGTLGAKAFNTSYESGRTKVKNIELGKQTPTREDLKRMALVLKAPLEALSPQGGSQAKSSLPEKNSGFVISKMILERFKGLDTYFDMLNKAIMLDDQELIEHISERLSALFNGDAADSAVNM